MNKIVLSFVVLAVLVVSLGTASLAFAQSPTPAAPVPGSGFGPGRMGGMGAGRGMMNAGVAGDAVLHNTMMAVFAEKLGISVADLEARLAKGETLSQIASSKGLTSEQFAALMADARNQAIDQAIKNGKISAEQGNWMKQRGFGMMGGRGRMGGMNGAGRGQFANPDCPYYTQPAS